MEINKKLKIIYRKLKGLLNQLPNENVVDSIALAYHKIIDELEQVAEEDCQHLKVEEKNLFVSGNGERYCEIEPLKTQVGIAVGYLEGLLDIEEDSKNTSPSVVIINKNKNELSVQINYTINDLINESKDKEEKEKLMELKDELEKPKKEWSKIKEKLIWIINRSSDLFLKILPLILEYYK